MKPGPSLVPLLEEKKPNFSSTPFLEKKKKLSFNFGAKLNFGSVFKKKNLS